MTEEKAKTKWCPMVDPKAAPDRCIASDCMMWKQDSSYWAKDGMRIKLEDYANSRTPEEDGLTTISEGHCGLTR